jgi:hypothetical protein
VNRRRAVLAVAGTLVALSGGAPVLATTPPTSPPPQPTTTVPPRIASGAIRAAKVGWSRFVADNFAVPTSVPDPCPLLAADVATGSVAAVGLIPSDLPFTVELYTDWTGGAITGIVCGVDLDRAASPAGATGYAVEATLLDGQVTFPQYVASVQGNNTPIVQSAELGGETVARCRSDPSLCLASWHGNGLVVTVVLEGPRTDESESQVAQLLASVVRRVVANLAAVPVAP